MKRVHVLMVAASFGLLPGAAWAAAEMSEVTLSAGRRVDNIDWNIAGNSVNVLSELTWTDIESYQIMAKTRMFIDRVYIRGHAGYAFITSGSNQDSDYAGDDRTLEFSRSNNRTDDGSLWDVSGGVGYLFRAGLPDGTLDLIPMAGLSYHKQNLKITDGYQTIPADGPFGGLNSAYSARWAGPWAGVDLSCALSDLTLRGSVEYHLAYFRAEADWNLRPDFNHPKSFEHWAEGSGVVISLGAEYSISGDLSVGGSFDFQDWSVSDGTDRTYFSGGSVSDTPLNEVNWESRAVMAGVKYRF